MWDVAGPARQERFPSGVQHGTTQPLYRSVARRFTLYGEVLARTPGETSRSVERWNLAAWIWTNPDNGWAQDTS